MRQVIAIFDFIFGCHHSHLSRVFIVEGGTYRVCCDCGARFQCSLDSMSMERLFPYPKGVSASQDFRGSKNNLNVGMRPDPIFARL
jgi:hypothetical protein